MVTYEARTCVGLCGQAFWPETEQFDLVASSLFDASCFFDAATVSIDALVVTRGCKGCVHPGGE